MCESSPSRRKDSGEPRSNRGRLPRARVRWQRRSVDHRTTVTCRAPTAIPVTARVAAWASAWTSRSPDGQTCNGTGTCEAGACSVCVADATAHRQETAPRTPRVATADASAVSIRTSRSQVRFAARARSAMLKPRVRRASSAPLWRRRSLPARAHHELRQRSDVHQGSGTRWHELRRRRAHAQAMSRGSLLVRVPERRLLDRQSVSGRPLDVRRRLRRSQLRRVARCRRHVMRH